MKFAQELANKLTSEWKSQYVDYNALKEVITRLEEETGQSEIKFRIMKSMISSDFIEREKEKLSETFFELQEKEETKVNLFFNEKISYAHRHLADISRNCEDIQMHRKKEEKRLKEAICEFYLFAKKLQAYQELNFTAFRKINKKHDKIMNSEEGAIRMSQIANSRFNIRSLTLNIIRDLESLMSNLENGDSKKAMNRKD